MEAIPCRDGFFIALLSLHLLCPYCNHMHSISKENCQNIGYFQKPHGISGSLVLQFTEGLEEWVEESPVLFVESEGILVPWFVIEDGIRITSSKTAIVDIEWIEDEPAAKKLCGKSVWIEKMEGQEEILAEENSAWVGYSVTDEYMGYLGVVNEVNDYAGNVVLTVDKDKTSQLVPFHPDLVIDINRQEKTLILSLPEGLSDMDI